jgi:hypothetical protein
MRGANMTTSLADPENEGNGTPKAAQRARHRLRAPDFDEAVLPRLLHGTGAVTTLRIDVICTSATDAGTTKPATKTQAGLKTLWPRPIFYVDVSDVITSATSAIAAGRP